MIPLLAAASSAPGAASTAAFSSPGLIFFLWFLGFLMLVYLVLCGLCIREINRFARSYAQGFRPDRPETSDDPDPGPGSGSAPNP